MAIKTLPISRFEHCGTEGMNRRVDGYWVIYADHESALAVERQKREEAERERDEARQALSDSRYACAALKTDLEHQEGQTDEAEEQWTSTRTQLTEANATIERLRRELEGTKQNRDFWQMQHEEAAEIHGENLYALTRELNKARRKLDESLDNTSRWFEAAHRKNSENAHLSRELDRARELLRRARQRIDMFDNSVDHVLCVEIDAFLTPTPAADEVVEHLHATALGQATCGRCNPNNPFLQNSADEEAADEDEEVNHRGCPDCGSHCLAYPCPAAEEAAEEESERDRQLKGYRCIRCGTFCQLEEI